MTHLRALTTTCGGNYRRAARAITAADKRLQRHIAHLPDPKETAFHLTERELFALSGAWLTPTGWRVRIELQAELAREGFCEVRGPHLTAYGFAVRRVVLEQQQ